ncbi:MAG: hypothetical protein AB8C84_04655 [Oligoflexales bacterium]
MNWGLVISIFVVMSFLVFCFYKKKIFGKKNKEHKSPYIKKMDKQAPKVKSEEWEEKFGTFVRAYHKHHVNHVFFVHGTFVGEDPLDFFYYLNSTFRKILQKYLKQAKKMIVKDNGMFSIEYVDLFQKMMGDEIKAHYFQWSSGNHHFARLSGALNLLFELAALCVDRKSKRFLLIGHSHAGQIFAILSQMICDEEKGRVLIQKACLAGYPKSFYEICETLHSIQGMRFDLVTLGTPVRYDFFLSKKISLLHIINHRKFKQPVNPYRSILNTEFGDYIQHWGSSGTDIKSPIPQVENVNKDLDHLFDIGRDLKLWRSRLKKERQIPKQGVTLLVDYQDQSSSINCVTTLFGHGIYTRMNTMLFHAEQIALFLDGNLVSDALNQGEYASMLGSELSG